MRRLFLTFLSAGLVCAAQSQTVWAWGKTSKDSSEPALKLKTNKNKVVEIAASELRRAYLEMVAAPTAYSHSIDVFPNGTVRLNSPFIKVNGQELRFGWSPKDKSVFQLRDKTPSGDVLADRFCQYLKFERSWGAKDMQLPDDVDPGMTKHSTVLAPPHREKEIYVDTVDVHPDSKGWDRPILIDYVTCGPLTLTQ
jgi:hypothetical protein